MCRLNGVLYFFMFWCVVLVGVCVVCRLWCDVVCVVDCCVVVCECCVDCFDVCVMDELCVWCGGVEECGC